jgi:hypothetical protein
MELRIKPVGVGALGADSRVRKKTVKSIKNGSCSKMSKHQPFRNDHDRRSERGYIYGATDDRQNPLPYYSGRLIVVKARHDDWPLLHELEDIAEQIAFLEGGSFDYAAVLQQTFPRKTGPDKMYNVVNQCKKYRFEYWLAERAFREDLDLLRKVFGKFRIQLADEWKVCEGLDALAEK